MSTPLEDVRVAAAAAYNQCWDALDAGDLALAVELASTSLNLWRRVPTVTAKNLAVGHWMLARVLALAGAGKVSLVVAESSLEHLGKMADPPPPDWLRASMLEGHARSLVAASDPRASAALALAKRAVESIADQQNRSLIAGQLDDLLPRFLKAEWATSLPVSSVVDCAARKETLAFFALLGFSVVSGSNGSAGEIQLQCGGASITLVPTATRAPGDGPVCKFTVADLFPIQALISSELPNWRHPSSTYGPVLRPHGLQFTALDSWSEACIWFVQEVETGCGEGK